MDYASHFKNKKITILGLGLLGRSVGDAVFLAECGADLIITDLKSETDLQESVDKLKDFKNVTFILGEHRLEDFESRDFILKSAGVPLNSEYIAHARDRGIPIEMSASLFAKTAQIPIIGVTGTRGKTTVTSMIHHVLSVTTEGSSVLLGGNIRGVSTLALLNKVEDGSIAVFELDSWQLQGFGDAQISPQIAVFTNFMKDHMDYYKGDMGAYFLDKANIFKNQEDTGVLVTTPEVFEYAKGKNLSIRGEVILADSSVMPGDCLLAMPGEHNRLNAALAYEALKATSLSDEMIFEGLSSFSGVEGRLQYMKSVDGVRIYNDNNATTPAATTAALEALDTGSKNIVLIAGGADKGIDPEELIKAIEKHCKQTILIPGTGTTHLLESLNTNVNISNIVAENLEQAVEEARLCAESGDIILFSPAFASFGQYANEYERNDEFLSLIQNI